MKNLIATIALTLCSGLNPYYSYLDNPEYNQAIDQMSKAKIILLGFPACNACQYMKNEIDKMKLDYLYVDIWQDKKIQTILQQQGIVTEKAYPQLIIDDDLYLGYDNINKSTEKQWPFKYEIKLEEII